MVQGLGTRFFVRFMTWYRLVLQFCAWYRVLVTVFSSGYDLVAAQVVWTLLSGGGYFLPFWYILPVHRTKVNLPPTATATPPLCRTDKPDKESRSYLYYSTARVYFLPVHPEQIHRTKVNLPQPGHHNPPLLCRTDRPDKESRSYMYYGSARVRVRVYFLPVHPEQIHRTKVKRALPQPTNRHHHPPLCRTDRPDKESRSYLYCTRVLPTENE